MVDIVDLKSTDESRASSSLALANECTEQKPTEQEIENAHSSFAFSACS